MAVRTQAIQFALSAAIMAVLISQAAIAQTPNNELRTWTSEDGKFSTEASFISYANGKAKLQKSDGKEMNIPVDRLSFADHKYISSTSNWGRVWRNASGKELFVARVESLDGKRVSLTAITGKKLKVKLSSLDPDSRKLVLSQKTSQTSDQTMQEAAPGASSTIAIPLDISASEEAIRRLISDCEVKSRRIRIDGRANDWKNLPTFYDVARIDDGSLDIERVGIAPRESDLIVMLQTRKRSAREDFSFFIRVDFLGQHEIDFQIGLSSSSSQKIKVYDEKNNSRLVADTKLDGLTVKVSEVVEVQIPYTALKSVLPKQMGDLLFGDHARPFIRVEAMSFDRTSRSIVDYGPSAASYRLLRNEYPLDAEAPGDVRNALPVSVPYEGKWFVGNGAMGYRAHTNVHAYDFYIMDRKLQPAKVRRSTDNQDYYSWGQPILSPIEGKVVRLETEHPDGTPLEKSLKRANKVVLAVRGSGGLEMRLLHFQQKRIDVKVGQDLRKAEVVGLDGNSGLSGFTHLHMDVSAPTVQGKSSTMPIAFDQAIVSLNPTPNDPWTRYVENWEIRAGVFVEKPRMPGTIER